MPCPLKALPYRDNSAERAALGHDRVAVSEHYHGQVCATELDDP